jgi:hypothetical protein
VEGVEWRTVDEGLVAKKCNIYIIDGVLKKQIQGV